MEPPIPGVTTPSPAPVHIPDMTLRDWFALCAPEMGMMDIAGIMGWPDLPFGIDEDGDEDELEPWQKAEQGEQDTVVGRWRALELLERLEAETRFRYLYADRMMLARLKASKPTST